MDVIQKKLTALDIIFWLRENYKMGKSGSTSKNAVYQHYLDMCQEKGIEPSISATYFGKLVKRAFPDVKYNRKGPRGGTKQHYTHLKRIDPSKKSVDRQLQQVPTELQQEYNYYHSINLEKEKEEMGPRMFGMFKMNREGAYVPSLSAMYASALEVEREEELNQRGRPSAADLPPPPGARAAAYGGHDDPDVNFLACLKPLAHPSSSSPLPSSRASPPLPSSSSSATIAPSFFPRLLGGPPQPTSPSSSSAYAAQAGGYPPPYYSGMAPPLPPNLSSAGGLPFDRDPSAPWDAGPAHHHRGLPSPYAHHPHQPPPPPPPQQQHPLYYLAAGATAGGSGHLPTSSSPTSSPRGSYHQQHPQSHHHHLHHHHPHQHQHQQQSPLLHGSVDIPYTSLPPLLAPPPPPHAFANNAGSTHLYRSSAGGHPGGLPSDADERREQTAQQREDSNYSPPALRHAP